MPISSHKNDKIKEIYEHVSEVIEIAMKRDNWVILWDGNAFVGVGIEPGVTENLG